MTEALALRSITAGYGRTSVLVGVDLAVDRGEVVSVLGPNGAGKSTLLAVCCGLLRASSGSVWLAGRDVTRTSADRRAREGLRMVAQGRRVFPSQTVRSNLLAAGASETDLDGLLDTFAVLRRRLDEPASALSGGEQQLVSLVRTLATRPGVLLLDEPSAGLASGMAAKLGACIEQLASQGSAVVLVEQDHTFARRYATCTAHLEDGIVTVL